MGCSCKGSTKFAVTMPNGTTKIVSTTVERDSLVSRGGTYKTITK